MLYNHLHRPRPHPSLCLLVGPALHPGATTVTLIAVGVAVAVGVRVAFLSRRVRVAPVLIAGAERESEHCIEHRGEKEVAGIVWETPVVMRPSMAAGRAGSRLAIQMPTTTSLLYLERRCWFGAA